MSGCIVFFQFSYIAAILNFYIVIYFLDVRLKAKPSSNNSQ